MKKLICALLAVVVMATLLAACGKFTCATCKKNKFGKSYEVLGVEICKDCYNDIQDAANALS